MAALLWFSVPATVITDYKPKAWVVLAISPLINKVTDWKCLGRL